MKDNKKPLVVVLSRSYSTGLSVIRSLGAAGYAVDLVASTHKKGEMTIASKSKYVRKFVEIVSQKALAGGDDLLIGELLKYAEEETVQKPVLFPTDDYTASIMDANRSRLEPIFLMPSIVGGGDGSMTACMDKTFQAELARRAGLLTPKEWIFSLQEKLDIPEDMIYPCFCKPIESVTGFKRDMAMCRDEQELKKHLRKLRKAFAQRSVIVQEFLQIDTEIDMSGVCLDQEIIIPAIIRKTHVAQYEKGVTLAGRVVPFEELGDICEKIIDMLKSFHYVGMFDMEFNIVGDRIYFNEVNLRSGGPNFSYFMSGVNLPALFVKEALGQRHTPEEEQVAAYGKSFIYEKVAWEDHIHGFMTREELNAGIAAADITLLCNDDDPGPGKAFHKKIRWTIVKKKVKNQKRWWKTHVKLWKESAAAILLGYPQTKRKNRRNPDSPRPRVVVAGRNYSSNLCMARSLGEAGYEVEVLRIFQTKPKRQDYMRRLKPDAYSEYVKAYHVCISRRKSRRIVEHLIRIADPNRKMLLIPADDLVAQVADERMEDLRPYYVLPNVNDTAGEITRLMNKGVQKELARAAGLPVLNSCVIKTKNGKVRIPEGVSYPCFIKPNVSKNSSKSRMQRCNNKKELIQTLKKFSAKKDVEMLVEDYVEIAGEYSLLGLSLASGVVVAPGFFRAEVGGQGSHRGVALMGKLLSCEDYQPLIDNLKRFVSSLNFEGLFDVDLIETTDGRMIFIEVNMRYGASGYAITRAGANLPGMYANYALLDKPVDPTCAVKEPEKLFVSEKVMIDEYAEGLLTRKELDSYIKQADIHFIQDTQDKHPYRHFRTFYATAAYVRFREKLREKWAGTGFRTRLKRWAQSIRTLPRTLRKNWTALPKWGKAWLLGYPQAKKANRRDPNARYPRVLVASRNYSSNLCMARALGEAGYEVEVLRIFHKKPNRKNPLHLLAPEARSKYVKAYHTCVWGRKNSRIVKELIRLATPGRKMLLIPADDLVAQIADENMEKLRKYYRMPNVKHKAGEVTRLMNKGLQKRLAEVSGIPVLNSCVVRTRNGKVIIPKGISYPCFVKPNISKDSSKKKMRKCDSEEELRKALAEFSRKRDVEMLVEDYVEIAKEYSLLGLSTGQGTVIPGFFAADASGHVERRGVALSGTLLSCAEQQKLIADLVRFVDRLQFEGLFDIDLIEDENGRLYFIELNMRYGTSGYALTREGVNLPGMFADYMLQHKPVDADCAIQTPGLYFVSERLLMEEYIRSYLSFADIKKYLARADITFINNVDDRAPYRHFQKFFVFAFMLRIYHRLKDKLKKI